MPFAASGLFLQSLNRSATRVNKLARGTSERLPQIFFTPGYGNTVVVCNECVCTVCTVPYRIAYGDTIRCSGTPRSLRWKRTVEKGPTSRPRRARGDKQAVGPDSLVLQNVLFADGDLWGKGGEMGREGERGEQGELTLLDLLGLVRVRKRRRRHSVVELDGKQRVRYAGVLFIMSTYSYDIFVVLLWYECGAGTVPPAPAQHSISSMYQYQYGQ